MRYLYVMLISLYENNTKGNIDLYVLQQDFNEADKKLIHSLSESYGNRVHYIWVDPTKFDVFSKGKLEKSTLSLEIYFRLLIPELLPEEIDRVLMLDVDLIVNHDITEFYDTDMTGYCLAAAPNICHNLEVRNEWRVWYKKNKKNWLHYNTGVLLWNLKELRKSYPMNYIFNQALDLKIDTLTFEEEVFNVLFGEDQIKTVSPEKWNYIVTHIYNFDNPKFEIYKTNEEIIKNCRIVHYAGQNPWHAGVKNSTFDIWWKYAKKTQFYHEFLAELYPLTEKKLEELAAKIINQDNKIFGLEQQLNKQAELLHYVDVLMDRGTKKKIIAYLKRNGFNHIILYGAGRIARCLYILLLGTEIIIDDFADKNYQGPYCGKWALAPEELEKHNSDLILVTTPYYYKVILDELKDQTSIEIRSIEDVVKEW